MMLHLIKLSENQIIVAVVLFTPDYIDGIVESDKSWVTNLFERDKKRTNENILRLIEE